MRVNPALKRRGGHTDNNPQLPAAQYLCFKEKQSLEGLPKISLVTDNLCLEIKAGLNCQALQWRLWWQSQEKEECRAREAEIGRERARLQCYSCKGMSVQEALYRGVKFHSRRLFTRILDWRGQGFVCCASLYHANSASLCRNPSFPLPEGCFFFWFLKLNLVPPQEHMSSWVTGTC